MTRALFGAGEAGAFPNLTRVLTIWLPVKERERAQAIVWLATRVSGAFTPILVAHAHLGESGGGGRSRSSASSGSSGRSCSTAGTATSRASIRP